jgi:hypothetical protein
LLDVALDQIAQRYAALGQLLSKNLDERAQPDVVIGVELHRRGSPVELQRAGRALEVVAGLDLFRGLVHGIIDLLKVDSGRYIERIRLGHGFRWERERTTPVLERCTRVG